MSAPRQTPATKLACYATERFQAAWTAFCEPPIQGRPLAEEHPLLRGSGLDFADPLIAFAGQHPWLSLYFCLFMFFFPYFLLCQYTQRASQKKLLSECAVLVCFPEGSASLDKRQLSSAHPNL